ncbi:hypothetical protein [Niabella aquatica]
MKKIEMNQMAGVTGGKLSNRDCMLRGAGTFLLVGLRLWGPAIALVATSGDCF